MDASAGDVLGRLQDVFAHAPIARSPSGPIRPASNYVFFGAVDEGDEQGLGEDLIKVIRPVPGLLA